MVGMQVNVGIRKLRIMYMGMGRRVLGRLGIFHNLCGKIRRKLGLGMLGVLLLRIIILPGMLWGVGRIMLVGLEE